jgi:hypothetical protein
MQQFSAEFALSKSARGEGLLFTLVVLAVLAVFLVAAGVLAVAEIPRLWRLAKDFREMR